MIDTQKRASNSSKIAHNLLKVADIRLTTFNNPKKKADGVKTYVYLHLLLLFSDVLDSP